MHSSLDTYTEGHDYRHFRDLETSLTICLSLHTAVQKKGNMIMKE